MRESVIRVTETTYTADLTHLPIRVNAAISGDDYDDVDEAARRLGAENFNIHSEVRVLEEVDFWSALNEIIYCLENGHKINAIKRLRELTGLGLYDCKSTIDRIYAVGEKRATDIIATGEPQF